MQYTLNDIVQILSPTGGFRRVKIRNALRKGTFSLIKSEDGSYHAILKVLPKKVKLWNHILKNLIEIDMPKDQVPGYALTREAGLEALDMLVLAGTVVGGEGG